MTDKERKVINIILSLLVATAAWFFVVYNYDPMTSVRYSGVPITYTGLDTLANRGYAVAEANYKNVEVTLQQRRVDTANISSEDISVTADVSGLSTGENTVALRVVGPEGTQVRDSSVKNVTVEIDSAASVEIPISVEYSEQDEENAVPLIENMSVETATVIATEERLAEIDRVAAVIDPEDLDEQFKAMTLEIAALDHNAALPVPLAHQQRDPAPGQRVAQNGKTGEISPLALFADMVFFFCVGSELRQFHLCPSKSTVLRKVYIISAGEIKNESRAARTGGSREHTEAVSSGTARAVRRIPPIFRVRLFRVFSQGV